MSLEQQLKAAEHEIARLSEENHRLRNISKHLLEIGQGAFQLVDSYKLEAERLREEINVRDL